MKIKNKKIVLFITVLISMIFLCRHFELNKYMNIESINQLEYVINSYGKIAPFIYILFFIVSCILFLPAPIMAVISGVLFGAYFGIIYTAIAALISDLLAFLIARYIARDFVKKYTVKYKVLNKIDDYIDSYGYKILIISRLLPGLPYILQSYAYGVSSMKIKKYIITSWICTLPGIIVFVLMGGVFSNPKMCFVYICAMIFLICFIFLIQKSINKRFDVKLK